MKNDTTNLFLLDEVNEKLVSDTLHDAINSLEERGYNAINQIVGYIISGDLGYISSYNDTRKRISKLDRSMVLEVILRNYVNK